VILPDPPPPAVIETKTTAYPFFPLRCYTFNSYYRCLICPLEKGIPLFSFPLFPSRKNSSRPPSPFQARQCLTRNTLPFFPLFIFLLPPPPDCVQRPPLARLPIPPFSLEGFRKLYLPKDWQTSPFPVNFFFSSPSPPNSISQVPTKPPPYPRRPPPPLSTPPSPPPQPVILFY